VQRLHEAATQKLICDETSNRHADAMHELGEARAAAIRDQSFHVTTEALKSGKIVQSTTDMIGQTVRKVVETEDRQVRLALMALGWTPPQENSEAQSAAISITDGPFSSENGLTVDELKRIVNSLPSKNNAGEDYEVWLDNGDGTTNPAKQAWMLNKSDDGCDLLLTSDVRNAASADVPPESKNKLAVKLTYFKQGGKYYSDGEFFVDQSIMLTDVWSLVVKMRNRGELPGLVEGAVEFNILVNVPGHPHEHPRLIMFNADS
jgi:hypothetical protein